MARAKKRVRGLRLPSDPGCLAGVLYEVQKRGFARDPEVVPVRFTTRGTALVPVGLALEEAGAPVEGRMSHGARAGRA